MEHRRQHPQRRRQHPKIFFALALAWIFPLAAWGLSLPDRPSARIHDEASLLQPAERQALENKIAAFELETSNQIVVSTFPSLDGESLEDFSIRLAEKWKIGQKDKDNGIILLIFPDDRKMRIEVGYGLEGVVPDALASRIMDERLRPAFRQGQFYAGIDAAVDGLMAATKGEYTAPPSSAQGGRRDAQHIPAPIVIILFLFFIVGLVLHILKSILFPFSGGRTWGGGGSSWGSSESSWGGGGGSFGGGGSSGSW